MAPALLLAVAASCNLLDGDLSGKRGQDISNPDEGVLSIRFLDQQTMTKSDAVSIPDTNSFILTVTSSDGSVLYDGKYSEAPVNLIVNPGTYDVTAVSSEFRKPSFDNVQWGDQQCVTVSAGTTTRVELICRQMNSGVRLSISPDFLTVYPSSSLLLKSREGNLIYSYSEKRTAFFLPGTVNLVMSTGSKDDTLLSRNLCSGEILSLKINVAATSVGDTPSTKGGISIQIDTARTYLEETYVIGAGSDGQPQKGEDWSNAFTISQARSNIGKKGVWIGGYVVGGDLTSKGISFEGPFKASSNLAIGPRSNTSSRNDCLSVQLSAGSVRDEINLFDNPDMLHKYVYLKGDIVDAYYGLVGIKNVWQYRMK